MPTECCVPGCHERGGHSFPKDEKQKKLWNKAIKRGGKGDNWKGPSPYSVVCARHFADEDYIQNTYHGTERQKKRLKREATPHKCIGQEDVEPPHAKRRRERYEAKEELEQEQERERELAIQVTDGCDLYEENIIEEPSPSTSQVLPAQSTQTDLTLETLLELEKEKRRALVTIEDLVDDPQLLHHYTGLHDYSRFCFVLQTLGPAAYALSYLNDIKPKLSVTNQFLLTLMKLKRNYVNFELQRWFGVSEKEVGSVIATWINFMYVQWEEIDWWPSRECVRFFSPSDFSRKFPTARVTLDATEIPTNKPKLAKAQRASFSVYKNRNTLKAMVGTSPGGLITYLSPAYGGSVSDRQIIERSNIIQKCDPGDTILADKGINVSDLCVPYNVKINIPTFFKKKNRMSGKTVLSDRKCSSKRCHVERHIGLGKTYAICATTNSLKCIEACMGTQIITVCYRLCSFRNCIMPKDA